MSVADATVTQLNDAITAMVGAAATAIATVPAWIKFSVSGVLWTLVFGWLWRGGRGSQHAD